MGGGLSKHPDSGATAERVNVLDQGTTASSDSSSSSDQTPSGPAQEESKCPMHKSDGSYSYDWTQLFKAAAVHGPKGTKPLSKEEQEKASGGGCPVQHDATQSSGCPVQHHPNNQHPEYNVYSQPIDKTNNMPKGAKTQLPNPYQTKELSTDRVSSTIPKGGDTTNTTWTYPSPQQFYNALSRKGKLDARNNDEASEEDMASVVALHNNMNEKTWAKVLEWERQTYGENATPKLLKFMGKPHDLSPKARFKYYVLGHPLPYDRHDWTVLRDDGTTVRYVIDYYYDETRAQETESSSMPNLHDRDGTPSLLVDVRPALDGPSQLLARAIQMPYKVATSQTDYDYLPLKGTPEMVSQVQESVKVWQSIQQARRQQTREEEAAEMKEELKELAHVMDEATEITDEHAKKIAISFALAMKDCQKAKQRMENCGSEEDCTRASMDLTLCFGERLCPVQHASFVKVLSASDDKDAEIEAALETVTECVMLKTAERRVARQQHPELFEN